MRVAVDHRTYSSNLRHVMVAVNHTVAKGNKNLSPSRIWSTASKRHTTPWKYFGTCRCVRIVLDRTLPAILAPLVQQIGFGSDAKLDDKTWHIAIESRAIEVSVLNELLYSMHGVNYCSANLR